ncbi:hypothetical protein Val02_52110 [Virgisporangium aliadipatigenens]|uniref:Double-GTPase 2 domain-containing protein n=1 Tax=Virgisporangium aliadipatigenens TaxID=741659 RepID=A0A8J4DRN5_9ACTN|nr:hypothetical protein [Virgisporangium aliadipatigenens]GIJ48325.1 hypothetical protein Val02_52110 [Virgisporangium aliadipatigenens]
MSRVACPYCYHRVDGGRLWYQCTGRGSPGRSGCGLAVDDQRVAEIGDREPVRPAFGAPTRSPFWPTKASCPKCGAESGIRVCPCCHSHLSSNFGAASSPLIAMVGAKGTGKTVFLNVLSHALLNDLRRQFGADVRLNEAGKRSSGKDGLAVDRIFRDHRLVEQTAQATEGRRRPSVFEWRQEHRTAGVLRRYRTTYLSFYDTAGEDLTSQETTYNLSYLGAADALILLLDPFMIPQARDRLRLPEEAIVSKESTVDVVNRVTEQLRSSHGIKPGRRIKIPLAVAFAKIDAFFDVLGPDHPLLRQTPVKGAYDDAAGQETDEQIRALLHSWEADGIDTHLRFNYSDFRYFAVSALGAPPDYVHGQVDPRGVRPFRVAEPLLWLLSRFHVIPRQRQG